MCRVLSTADSLHRTSNVEEEVCLARQAVDMDGLLCVFIARGSVAENDAHMRLEVQAKSKKQSFCASSVGTKTLDSGSVLTADIYDLLRPKRMMFAPRPGYICLPSGYKALACCSIVLADLLLPGITRTCSSGRCSFGIEFSASASSHAPTKVFSLIANRS